MTLQTLDNPLSTMQYVTCGQAQMEQMFFWENLQNGLKCGRRKSVKHA